MHKQRTAVLAGLAGFTTLAVIGAATTESSAGTDGRAAPEQRVAAAAATAVRACDGGTLVYMRSRSSAVPFSFAGSSGSDVPISGARIPVTGPRKGKDTFLITFSAETHYTGAGWMGLEVQGDGVPAQPFADNGSPFAFGSEATYGGSSAQFCVRLGKGRHVLTAVASTTGDAGETGWLDDWTMSVLRFD